MRVYLDKIPNTDGGRDLILYVDPSDGSIIISGDGHIAHTGANDIVKINKRGLELMHKAILRAPWVKEPNSQ